MIIHLIFTLDLYVNPTFLPYYYYYFFNEMLKW